MFGETPTIVATPGEQTWGTDGRDVIRGTDGRDEIFGGGGDDLICGGWGDDYVNPHGGRDRVRAGEGDDLVWARDEEADDIDGGRGNDGAAIDQGADAINDVEDSDF